MIQKVERVNSLSYWVAERKEPAGRGRERARSRYQEMRPLLSGLFWDAGMIKLGGYAKVPDGGV